MNTSTIPATEKANSRKLGRAKFNIIVGLLKNVFVTSNLKKNRNLVCTKIIIRLNTTKIYFI